MIFLPCYGGFSQCTFNLWFPGRIYTYNDPRIKKTIIQKDYTHCAAISYNDKKIQDILENQKSDDKPPKGKRIVMYIN